MVINNSIVVLSWFIKQLDWLIKADVLKIGLCKDVKQLGRAWYNWYLGKSNKTYNDIYTDLLLKHGAYYLDTAQRLNNSSFSRVRRLKRRITKYLSLGQCIWATLTFNDDVLDSTDEKTRRKYVQRYLKGISSHYIANIDFGSDDEYIDRHGNKRVGTEREHYHALILIDFVNEKWKYGWTKFEKVHRSNSEVCIAKYITKLTNHYIKKSTKRNYCIYSRL